LVKLIGNLPFNTALLGLRADNIGTDSGFESLATAWQGRHPSETQDRRSSRVIIPGSFGFWGTSMEEMVRHLGPSDESDVLIEPPIRFPIMTEDFLAQSQQESMRLYSDGSRERPTLPTDSKTVETLLAASQTGDTRTSNGGNYTGWSASGFSVDQPDDVRMHDRLDVGSIHLAPVTLNRRDGKKLLFKFSDQYAMGTNPRDLFKRTMSCEEIPEGFTQVGKPEMMTLKECGVEGVFIEPNMNRVCVLTFSCYDTTSEYYGMTVSFILGLVQIVGRGTKTYTHKKNVGMRISGKNPLIGNSWEAEFNNKLPRVTKDVDHVGQYSLIHNGDSFDFSWPTDEHGHPQDFSFFNPPAGYEIIPDPLERNTQDYPKVVILKTPSGDPLVIINDNGDVALTGQPRLITKKGNEWEVSLSQKNQKLLVSDQKGPLYVRQQVGQKVKKIARKADQVHAFAHHTSVVYPLDNSPVSVTRLDTGELLVLDLDESTYFAFLGLQSGWSRQATTRALSEDLFSRTHLTTVTRAVMNSPIYYTAKGVQRGRVHILDEELGIEIFITDLTMTPEAHLPVDLHYAHVVVREIGSTEYLDLPIKVDPDTGKIMLMHLATYTVLDLQQGQDARPHLVIEADYESAVTDVWHRITTKSTRKPYEALINGLPVSTFALPGRSQAIKRMHAAASKGQTKDSEIKVQFHSALSGDVHDRFSGKAAKQPLWDMDLVLTSEQGRLVPQTADDGVAVMIPRFLYRQVMDMYGTLVLKNHSFNDVLARLISTTTNRFGWALEVALCNNRGLGHTIYIQPVNDVVAGHDKFVSETPVIGLQISTELEPISDDSKQAFVDQMLTEGGYLKKPIQLKGVGKTGLERAVKTSATLGEALERLVGHSELDFSKAPFEPGHEAMLDEQTALGFPFTMCKLGASVDVALAVGEHRITGLKVLMWKEVNKVGCYLDNQEATIEMADGNKREAVVFQHAGHPGQYYLIDKESGVAYPLYLTELQLYLSTTPISLAEPIPQAVIDQWKKLDMQQYQRNIDFYSLKHMPADMNIRLTRNPQSIEKEFVWQDIYIHDGNDFVAAVGVQMAQNAKGMIDLPSQDVRVRFLAPGKTEFEAVEAARVLITPIGRSRGIRLLSVSYFHEKEKVDKMVLGVVFAMRGGVIIPISVKDRRYFKSNGTLKTREIIKRFERISHGHETFDVVPIQFSGLASEDSVLRQETNALGLPHKKFVKQDLTLNTQVGTRTLFDVEKTHSFVLEEGDFRLTLDMHFDLGPYGHIRFGEDFDVYNFRFRPGAYVANTKSGPRKVFVEPVPGDPRQYWLIDDETGERFPLFLSRSTAVLSALPHKETATIPSVATYDFVVKEQEEYWQRALMWSGAVDDSPLEPDYDSKKYKYKVINRAQFSLSPTKDGFERTRTALLYDDGSSMVFDHVQRGLRDNYFERVGYVVPGDTSITWAHPQVIDYTDIGSGMQTAVLGARDPTRVRGRGFDDNMANYAGVIFVLSAGDIHPVLILDSGVRNSTNSLNKGVLRNRFNRYGFNRRDWLVELPDALKGIVDME
jgi:hypothetical protein